MLFFEGVYHDHLSEILSQALESAQNTNEYKNQARFLANIGYIYAKAGQDDKSTEFLDQAHELSPNLNDAYKAQVLFLINTGYSVVGQNDKAWEILLEASQEKYYRYGDIAWVLAEIGSNEAKSGQKVDDKRRKILHEIIREVDRRKNNY